MADQLNPPIVCDMTTAVDTPDERLAEYRALFGEHLVDRMRTPAGIRFRFRSEKGIADQVQDLATRESACCAFFSSTVTEDDGLVVWDAAVVDDPIARQVLDEFYVLPDTADLQVEEMHHRFRERGLEILSPPGG